MWPSVERELISTRDGFNDTASATPRGSAGGHGDRPSKHLPLAIAGWIDSLQLIQSSNINADYPGASGLTS
jgi:hypothetical protein